MASPVSHSTQKNLQENQPNLGFFRSGQNCYHMEGVSWRQSTCYWQSKLVVWWVFTFPSRNVWEKLNLSECEGLLAWLNDFYYISCKKLLSETVLKMSSTKLYIC